MEYLTLPFLMTIITSIFIGAAAGYLGSFMILRKMSLVGDALSHVALPGIAIAMMLKVNPFLGAFSFLFLAVVGIWLLEERSSASTETLVGIFFTASLSLGILLTDELELLEALFGDITKVSSTDMAIGIALSIVAIFITYKISKELLLSTISKDLAMSAGVNTSRIDFTFLMLVAVIVALGIKIAGSLLTGALVIIPAAAAKNISDDFKNFSQLSLIFGIISALSGIALSSIFSYHPGPMIVLSGTFIFLITFALRK
jgi:ABC-type Mn2+/Zn2+ transport system permease subunit